MLHLQRYTCLLGYDTYLAAGAGVRIGGCEAPVNQPITLQTRGLFSI